MQVLYAETYYAPPMVGAKDIKQCCDLSICLFYAPSSTVVHFMAMVITEH